MCLPAGLTDGHDIHGSSNPSQVEFARSNGFAASREGDRNWSHVAKRQENDSGAIEGVEGCTVAQVNQAKKQLDDGTEQHRVEWNAGLLVDLIKSEHARAWDGTVSGESPGAPGSSGAAPDTAEEAENNQRHGQDEGTDLAANSRPDNSRDWLARLVCHHGGNVLEDEADRHEEDEAAGHVEQNCTHKSLRDLCSGLLHFFAHGHNHSGGGGGIRCVQQSNAEGPTWRSPAGLRVETTKSVRSAVPSLLCDGQNGADDREHTDEGENHSTSIEHRQPSVSVGRHSSADQSDSEEDQVCLIRCRWEDGVAVGVCKDVDAADQEESGTEVD